MFAPDARLGNYRLIQQIGAGGMGEVWKAEDLRLGRMVAIKILPPAIASDPEAIARMRREARTAAQINHPNIATIYAFEESDEHRFIAMELVEGEPLTKRIERGALPEAEVCRIGRAAADALAEAHAQGVIHRDIKPDNIMVGGTRVKVLDFGIAKQVEVVSSANDPTAPLTQQGMIIGTIQYMSPEQALGRKLGRATDVFSLGVVLYQAATGRLPFQGESVTETLTQIIRDDPPAPTGVSAGLAAIIERCLRKNPDERYSAGELATALDAQRGGAPTVITAAKAQTVREMEQPPIAKRRGLAAIVFALIAVVLGALVATGLLRKNEKPAETAPPVQTTAAAAPSTATVDVATPAVPPATAAPTATITEPAVTVTTSREPETRVPEPPAASSTVAEETVRNPRRPAPEPKPEISASQRVIRGEEFLYAREPVAAREEFRTALEMQGELSKMERGIALFGIAFSSGNRRRALPIFETLQREFPDEPRVIRLRTLVGPQRPLPQRGRGQQRPMRRP